MVIIVNQCNMERVEGILKLASTPFEGVTDNATICAAVKAKNSNLTGQSDVDEAAVIQWLVFSEQQFSNDVIKKLNNILAEKSYLVGQRLTLADIAVTWSIAHQKVELNDAAHVARWFEHIIHTLKHQFLHPSILVQPIVPISLPIFVAAEAAPTKPAAAVVAAAVAPDTSATNNNKQPEDKKGDAKEAKKEDNKTEKKKDAQPNVKEEKKDASEAATAQDDMDPSKLDIRVGLVVKCWNHPDSEKLLCEEIDLGEGSNRLIASGIRAHYSAEEVQGRKVMVLSNLKERSIAGFKSQGMVLCASNKDHTVVRLLEPPTSAKVGDRVVFSGFSGEPATPAQIAKKKIFETLAPFMRTDSAGVAHWKTSAFLIGGEQCQAPVPDAVVA